MVSWEVFEVSDHKMHVVVSFIGFSMGFISANVHEGCLIPRLQIFPFEFVGKSLSFRS